MSRFLQPFKKIVLSDDDFEYFRRQIHDLAGIFLTSIKKNLIHSRLHTRVVSLNFDNFHDYRRFLEQTPSNHPEWQVFINLLTTNKTSWFREYEHFDMLINEFLPQWKTFGKKKLNVWCAACSTGEEPYTLALVLAHALKGSSIGYCIHATDIDTRALEIAQRGVYQKDSLVEIPPEYHHLGFDFGKGDIASWIRVKKSIKEAITFKQFNLLGKHFLTNGKFDLIFCRNVLIYFNPPVVEHVVQALHRQSEKDALLVISHSESIQNFVSPWTYLRPSIYSSIKSTQFMKLKE